MPLYQYYCKHCDKDVEIIAAVAARHDQPCPSCGGRLEKVQRPMTDKSIFQPYMDEGLGVFITGRDHRRRVMRDLQCDFRDHMSKGDRSARLDKINQQRRDRSQ